MKFATTFFLATAFLATIPANASWVDKVSAATDAAADSVVDAVTCDENDAYCFEDVTLSLLDDLMTHRFMSKIEGSFQTAMTTIGDPFTLLSHPYETPTTITTNGMTITYELEFTSIDNLSTGYGVSMSPASGVAATIYQGSNMARAKWDGGSWDFEIQFATAPTFGITVTYTATDSNTGISTGEQTATGVATLADASLTGTVDLNGYTKINNRGGNSKITYFNLHDNGALAFTAATMDLTVSLLGTDTTVTGIDVAAGVLDYFDVMKGSLEWFVENTAQTEVNANEWVVDRYIA